MFKSVGTPCCFNKVVSELLMIFIFYFFVSPLSHLILRKISSDSLIHLDANTHLSPQIFKLNN